MIQALTNRLNTAGTVENFGDADLAAMGQRVKNCKTDVQLAQALLDIVNNSATPSAAQDIYDAQRENRPYSTDHTYLWAAAGTIQHENEQASGALYQTPVSRDSLMNFLHSLFVGKLEKLSASGGKLELNDLESIRRSSGLENVSTLFNPGHSPFLVSNQSTR